MKIRWRKWERKKNNNVSYFDNSEDSVEIIYGGANHLTPPEPQKAVKGIRISGRIKEKIRHIIRKVKWLR